MKVAAFYDLDGTIVKGISGLRFSRFLFRRKIMPINLSVFKPIIKSFYDYVREDSYKYMDHGDDMLAIAFKGLKKSVVEEQAKQYANLELNNIYKKVLKTINYHKSRNHLLFLLSVSPHELVKEFGELLGFNESFGTRLVSKKGVYTGGIETPCLIGKDRLVIVKKLAKEHDIDLKNSFAYGDSLNDVFILNAVGNPFIVNPTRRTKPLIKEKGWKVL